VVALRFDIEFHTPFRVASGQAGNGSDTTVDRQVLLPASSLKGVFRSAARDLLKFPPAAVEAVFGTERHPSPWSWSDATVAGTGGHDPEIRPRARIRIDPETATTATGALAIADEVLAARGAFSIDRTGWIRPGDAGWHETVLLGAGRAVTAVGGDRRRGLGWVTITPADPPWTQARLDAALRLARGEADA
jgi:CRISPR/Cas system CSM-associated protein Csm3 (group 7 of RAMP superfamily)